MSTDTFGPLSEAEELLAGLAEARRIKADLRREYNRAWGRQTNGDMECWEKSPAGIAHEAWRMQSTVAAVALRRCLAYGQRLAKRAG